MMRILRWGLALIGIIIATTIAFSIYANFLLDYSMDSLQFTLGVANKDQAEMSPLAQNIYQTLLRDLSLEEATKENTDIKSLVLLEIASRSMGEAAERAGNKRASLYLSQVMEKKTADRKLVLKIIDRFYALYSQIKNSLRSFFDYLFRRFRKAVSVQQPQEYSGILILNHAMELEKAWRLDEASDLYQKYLKTYPGRADQNYIMLSLAQVLIKQRKFVQARKYLEDIILYGREKEEGRLANALIKKIDGLQNRKSLIAQLGRAAQDKPKGSKEQEEILFKLALAYLSSYQIQEAQKLLEDLAKANSTEIRQKAKFYLGWSYKLNAQYEKGVQIFQELLEDPNLEKELGLGLQAALADIYYQQKDVEKSLTYYKALSREAAKTDRSARAASEAWTALSDLEQANIYLFDLKDNEKAENRLADIDKLLNKGEGEAIRKASKISLRDKGFAALKSKEIHAAYGLFNKHLGQNPNDPYTYSALATIHVLFGDIDRSIDYASKAYKIRENDEYTASVNAYVLSLSGRGYEKPILLYTRALQINPLYLPARFNLAHLFLETRRFREGLYLLEKLDQDLSGDRNLMRAKILNNMGYAYWNLKDTDSATKRFRSAVQIYPNFALAAQNLEKLSAGEQPELVTFKE